MKRIKRRSAATLLLVIFILLGVGLFAVRLVRHGGEWALYRANTSVYKDGMLSCGTLTDRNGLILATADDGAPRYAEDPLVRKACLHAVGDYRGFIGSGALTVFAPELAGYSLWHGTTGQGETVRLSIDTALQTAALTALNGRNGAVMVINYETGEVLCMVSAPTYDPAGEADESIEGLYLNRCIEGLYTPGSVYKLVTLAAAIDTIPDLDSRRFYCHQHLQIGSELVVCSGNHGEQTIEQALGNSCNCAFGELALELGADTLNEYAHKLGVAGPLELDSIPCASGRYDRASEGSAGLAWSGIGQYTDLVSPYAMARLSAAIAGGGTLREPTLHRGGSERDTELLSPETAGKLGSMMHSTVVNNYGEWRFPGLDLCAKSGTAETGSGPSHAWFTGYLQSGVPLAFAVVIEEGGGGLIQAGAVANTVLQKATELYGQ